MWLQFLAAELQITLADGTVWVSISQGLLIGAVCLLFGVWVARFVGLLDTDARAGETLGVGLASGLLVLTSWWAAIMSAGRSSFTPVALGFAIAIGLALFRLWRPAAAADPSIDVRTPVTTGPSRASRLRDLFLALVGGAVFVAAIALLYGSTMAPSPRDGVQPIEFSDEAYYAVLGADLAKTGTESLFSPSGLTDLPGLPAQTWYHWGEAWLGSIAIGLFGTEPLDARHFVALPLLLLAAAALTGTLVRRLTGSTSRGAFLFGFFACLFLAPMPFISGPFFSSWAVGMIFGITLYGLAAMTVLLALYSVSVLGERPATWVLEVFVGNTVASIIPAHPAIALLAVVGVGSVSAIKILRSLAATRRLPAIRTIWRRTFIATGIAVMGTVVWGLLTGHGLGSSWLSPTIPPFDLAWRSSIAIVLVCSGAFLAIAIAWFTVRREASIGVSLYLGTIALFVFGAIVWGARLGDLNMGHLFFGGIAVFATPVAAIAVWSIWLRLRATGHVRLAVAVLVFCVAQLELGIAFTILRLQAYGPGTYPPVSLETLATIRTLPPDSKLAYACGPFDETAFWAAQLLSLDAHTGRRVVPMCFQAETYPVLFGRPLSPDVPSPLFELAPQRVLYPNSQARPSPTDVASFLRTNGVEYIYADSMHPNTLVPDAIPIATSGDTQVLRLP